MANQTGKSFAIQGKTREIQAETGSPCKGYSKVTYQQTETLESAGISLKPVKKQGAGRMLEKIATALRRLPVPVIGPIDDGELILDLRCLEREDDFIRDLKYLDLAGGVDVQ